MKNLDDLRAILFEEIEHVKNNPNAESLARANVVNSLAQSLIGTAKAEADFARSTGIYADNGFIARKALYEPQQEDRAVISYGKMPEKQGTKF